MEITKILVSRSSSLSDLRPAMFWDLFSWRPQEASPAVWSDTFVISIKTFSSFPLRPSLHSPEPESLLPQTPHLVEPFGHFSFSSYNSSRIESSWNQTAIWIHPRIEPIVPWCISDHCWKVNQKLSLTSCLESINTQISPPGCRWRHQASGTSNNNILGNRWGRMMDCNRWRWMAFLLELLWQVKHATGSHHRGLILLTLSE